jgi:proline dehydrogenase
MSSLDHLTVNIQANNNSFHPPIDNSVQINALAIDTQAQMEHLRSDLQRSLQQGSISITERLGKIGEWCQEVYKC